MGWLTSNPGTTDWIQTGEESSKRVLHDGALSVSQTVTRTEYVLNYNEEQLLPPSSSDLANNATPTGSNTWQVTRTKNIRAVCDITVKTYEARGYNGPRNGTAQTASGKSQSLSIAAYDSGFIRTSWDGKTWKGYRVTAAAATATLDFPECQGTQITFSSRRVNEAGGWTVVKTETIMDTTITEF